MVYIGEIKVKIQAKFLCITEDNKKEVYLLLQIYANSSLQAWCDCILSSQCSSSYLKEEI